MLHQKFLTENKITQQQLSQPIIQKIALWKELQCAHTDAEGDCQQKVRRKLNELDKEILADLLLLFEHHLNNNELKERKTKPSKAIKPKEKEPSPQLSKEERLLEDLWKSGNTKNLSKSYLKGIGLALNYEQKRIVINNFLLERTSIFSYTFHLKKVKG